MESSNSQTTLHILAIPYPSQGHINPLLQFAKRLTSTKHTPIKITFLITHFISKTFKIPTNLHNITFQAFSDAHDQAGFAQADSIHSYLKKMEAAGSKDLTTIITQHDKTPTPVTCVVYDPFLNWALEVAKQFGRFAAAFFTQPCAVNLIYYLVYNGKLKLPVKETPVCVDEKLPLLEIRDLPSFLAVDGQYPAYLELVLNQFANTDRADFVLVNSFHDLEPQEVQSMSKHCHNLLTVGPTIPSLYLDNRVQNDSDYDINLYEMDPTTCTNWLKTKPNKSVIYISFGSMATLSNQQMEELAAGLKQTNHHFLWVVRPSEESKLPKGFVPDKGLLVQWSPQLQVLASESLGCVLSHGGWNSTIEALSLGVPMVLMPQWTDQPVNAKYVEDVWEVGVRVRVGEDGVVRRGEIVRCVEEVMEGRGGIRERCLKWRELAVKAVGRGGSTDGNIHEFVTKLVK